MIIAQVKNQLGTLIGGGTVEFFDASTGYRLTVMDDDASDQWNKGLVISSTHSTRREHTESARRRPRTTRS
jgi:hypothetical protein